MTGSLPKSIDDQMPNLMGLLISDAHINGSLPQSLCRLWNLKYLVVSNNRLSGTIPNCWSTLNLNLLDLSSNNFTGVLPSWFGNLSNLDILNLAKNQLEGEPYAICYRSYIEQVVKSNNFNYSYLQLYSMVNIDLSNNNLYGQIPSELTTVKGLFGLNLWHNNLLESLDLSFNKLSGPIPKSMSSLSALGMLNLSIPREGHLSTFNDASNFEGNPYLCGDPLSVECPNENSGDPPAEVDNFGDNGSHEEDKFEKMWFYIFVMLGYSLGFWGVVGTLIWKRRWRHAYFQFMDETKDRIYVAILVNMTRLKQQLRGNNNIHQ